jgi:outer membrane protein assembly factor BamA
VGYYAATEWRTGRLKRHAIGFGLRASQTAAATDDQPLSRSEDGWAALLLRRDYRDYYINEGVGGYLYSYFGPDFRLELGARSESQRSVHSTTAWSLFRSDQAWRPNPLIDDGRYVTLGLGLEYDTRNQQRLPSAGWWIRARMERSTAHNVAPLSLPTTIRAPIPTDGSYAFGRLTFDARMYNRLTPDMRLNARVVGAGWLGGDPLPVQRRVALGGPDLLPGYGFRALNCAPQGYTDPAATALCDRMLAAQVELRSRLDLGLLVHVRDREHQDLDRAFGLTQADLVIFTDAGKAWLTGDGPGRVANDRIPALREWRADVGLGLDAGGIGVYVAKGLSSGQPVQFTVRLQQRF